MVDGVSFEPGAVDADRDLRHLVLAPTGAVEVTSDALEPSVSSTTTGVPMSQSGASSGPGGLRLQPGHMPVLCAEPAEVAPLLDRIDVAWDRAERRDVRDFVLWMKGADNPQRHHGRPGASPPGTVNAVTGKRTCRPVTPRRR